MKKSSGSRFRKQRLTAVGIRCADHVTPLYPQKLALTSPTGGSRSVGIVRVRTKATEFSFSLGVISKPHTRNIRWTDGVKNEVLHRVNEERFILHTVKKTKG